MSALTAAQRAQAQSAFDLAQSTVDSLTLKAPVGGIVQLGGSAPPASSASSITDLLGGASAGTTAGGTGPGVDPAVGAGGLVATGTPLFTVVDVSQLGLLANVDETDILLVQAGVAADVELDAVPGDTYHATVTTIDELPSTTTQGDVAYRVRLTLAGGTDPDGKAAPTPKPGMNAVAHLKVRSAQGAVTVPAAAVFNANGRDQVWIVRDGKAVRTAVTVGVAGQDSVQVVSGLGDGQELVVRGADKVSAGMKLP
jgi:RND family efflux transporter MFP subunit